MTRAKKAFVRIGVLLVCCALVVGGSHVSRRLQVDSAIREYQASPTSETAARLVRLLDAGIPNREEGSLILALLLEPEVTVRSPYAVNAPFRIGIRQKWSFVLGDLRMAESQTVLVGKIE